MADERANELSPDEMEGDFELLTMRYLDGVHTNEESQRLTGELAVSSAKRELFVTMCLEVGVLGEMFLSEQVETDDKLPLAKRNTPVLGFLGKQMTRFGISPKILVGVLLVGYVAAFTGLTIWRASQARMQTATSNPSSGDAHSQDKTAKIPFTPDRKETLPGTSPTSDGSQRNNEIPRTAQVVPTDLVDLHAWWKADAIEGVTGGQSVTAWADSSGNGHTMRMYHGPRAPTFSSAGLNGRPSVHFSTYTIGMQVENFGIPAGDPPYTLFVVFSEPTLTSKAGELPLFTHPFTFGDAQGNIASIEFGRQSEGMLQIARGYGKNYCTSYTSETYPNKIISVRKAPGPIHKQTIVAVDGFVTPASQNAASTELTNNFSEKSLAWMGFAVIGAEGLDAGEIAEVILYDRALTDAEEHSIGTYLQRKYGLSGGYSPRR